MIRAFTILLLLAGCATPPRPRQAPPLSLAWQKNVLTVSGGFPGGKINIWYLEAYCRSGARDVAWQKTVIPHKAEKLSDDGKTITLRDVIEGNVVVRHRITAGDGEVTFEVEAKNEGPDYVDAQWAQPCIRVGGFTGGNQQTYVEKSFIFVEGKQTFLPQARRTEEAIYKGGQLYIPAGIKREDCNPRPHSPDVPSNDLIGCVSGDGRWLFATAWTPTQELFQGVIVCLQNDFRLGGLKPGETKRARGKVYVMENDVELLLARYRSDFP